MTEEAEQSTALAVIEIKNPALVFVANGLDPFIGKIKEEVRKEQPNLDISTAAGRKAITSLAYKIAQTKTKLDKIGKTLNDEQQAAINAVNAERNRVWAELETLQKEVRAPLTAWEDAEEKRVKDHEDAILVLKSYQFLDTETSAEGIERQITSLIDFGKSRNFEEFAIRAQFEHKTSYEHLLSMLEKKKKSDADAAELARLKAAEDARLQKERDEQIAAAATKAAEEKAAADAKALADKVAADQKKAEDDKAALAKTLADALAKAEADKKQAAIDAQKKADDAAAAERQKAADAKAAEDAATKKREADQAHKAKINNEALEKINKILTAGLGKKTEDTAKALVIAIAKGEIPHTTIAY